MSIWIQIQPARVLSLYKYLKAQHFITTTAYPLLSIMICVQTNAVETDVASEDPERLRWNFNETSPYRNRTLHVQYCVILTECPFKTLLGPSCQGLHIRVQYNLTYKLLLTQASWRKTPYMGIMLRRYKYIHIHVFIFILFTDLPILEYEI